MATLIKSTELVKGNIITFDGGEEKQVSEVCEIKYMPEYVRVKFTDNTGTRFSKNQLINLVRNSQHDTH